MKFYPSFRVWLLDHRVEIVLVSLLLALALAAWCDVLYEQKWRLFIPQNNCSVRGHVIDRPGVATFVIECPVP